MSAVQSSAASGTEQVRGRRWLAVVALVLLAGNLRIPLTEVGPVLPRIRAEFGFSSAQSSLLTSLPVLFFGVCAPALPFLLRRLGIDRTVVGALLVLLGGSTLRLFPAAGALLVGTVALGGSIAVCNVILPVLVKTRFPDRTGSMTGLYTMALNVAASAAAGSIVPLVDATGGSWRRGFAFWILPVAVAIGAWVTMARSERRPAIGLLDRVPTLSLLRNVRVQALVVFTASQSIVYYGMIAWLPSIFQSSGASASESGVLLSVTAFIGAPVALVLPAMAARAKQQSGYALALALFAGSGLAGLLLAPMGAPYLWAILLGIGQGGVFPLSLTLFVLRTRSADQTAGLSVLAQSTAYVCAAIGPFLMGLLHDHTGSWHPSIWILLAALVVEAFTGVLAGRPGRL